jgi:DNA-binding MarR family transcriptional regulator
MTNELSLRVIRKLIATGPILQRGFEARIQPADDDATMIQVRSLALISAGPMTISELAGLRQVSLQTASETVKHLEERAWVGRVRNPKDRRQWLITLTHAGLQQLEAARNYAVSQMIPHLMELTDDEMVAIEIALDALARVFSIPDVTQLSSVEEKDAS